MIVRGSGGFKVVLGRWGGGGPQFGGFGGLSLVVVGLWSFYVALFHAQGVPPPLGVGVFFFLVLIHFDVGWFGFLFH